MSTPDKSIDPRLIASAEEEFLKHGFLKSELKTICENADITTGAVYKRYKGKEDLFCAIVDEIANDLNGFVKKRASVDLASLSDDEIYNSLIMTYDAMLPLFRMLFKQRDKFTLLVDKAAGTKYENFSHEYVTKMSSAYEKYYAEAKRRGLAQANVSRKEFHVLLSSFWTCICEPIIHDMSWNQIKEHCMIVCRFFNWKEVIMLRKDDE